MRWVELLFGHLLLRVSFRVDSCLTVASRNAIVAAKDESLLADWGVPGAAFAFRFNGYRVWRSTVFLGTGMWDP